MRGKGTIFYDFSAASELETKINECALHLGGYGSREQEEVRRITRGGMSCEWRRCDAKGNRNKGKKALAGIVRMLKGIGLR